MSSAARTQPALVDRFFMGTEVRYDRWRSLHQQAREWESAASRQQPEASINHSQVVASLNELRQWEYFYGDPGPQVLNLLIDRVSSGDAVDTARMARINST